MSLLDRYILRSLVAGLTVGTVALLALIWLINSLKFLDWFINKGLSLITFLKVTWLLMPGFLTVFIPLALFAVTIFTYSKLASDRELVVMRATGMSPWRLARPAVLLCAGLTVLGYVLTLGVVPDLERSFDDIKTQVQDDLSGMILRDGQFNQMEKNLIVYVGRRTADGVLHDLMIHDTSNATKEATVLAQSGALVRTDTEVRLLLLNGNRQERDAENNRVTFLYFDSYSLTLASQVVTEDFRYRNERQRDLGELIHIEPGDRMDPNFPYVYENHHVMRLRMELHLRILRPLGHFGYLLIALGAVLSGQFNRRGNAVPVATAVALVVLFQAGSLGAASMAKKSYDALLLLDAMTILPMVVGAFWMADGPSRLGLMAQRLRWRRPVAEGAS